MGYKASNNADTTLSESITQTSTTIAVATGRGDDFPTLGATDWTLITITDKNGAREIIKIIARTGDTMTVGTTPGGEADVGGRAQEGTTALSITYTDDHSVRCCPTAGLIEAMADYSDQGDLTATPAEIEAVCKGNTATAAELSELHESGVVKVDLEKLHNITLSASQINAFESLKNDFEALRTCFSGSSAPGNPVAGMWWYDTTANMLKIRNEANDAWLDVYDFANARAPLALGLARTVVAGTGISVSGNFNSGNVTVGISAGGVGSTQLANGGVSPGKLANYSAGNYVEWPSDIKSYSATTSSWTELTERVYVARAGTVRVRWRLSNTSGDNCDTRVYKNGVAVGSVHTNYVPTDYYEDISVAAGDYISIYGRNHNAHTLTIVRFAICCGNPIIAGPTWTEFTI